MQMSPSRLRRSTLKGRRGRGVECGEMGRGGWENYSSRRASGGSASPSRRENTPTAGPTVSRGPVPASGFPRLGPVGRVASGLCGARSRAPSSSSACPAFPPLWRVSCRGCFSSYRVRKEEGPSRTGPLGQDSVNGRREFVVASGRGLCGPREGAVLGSGPPGWCLAGRRRNWASEPLFTVPCSFLGRDEGGMRTLGAKCKETPKNSVIKMIF